MLKITLFIFTVLISLILTRAQSTVSGSFTYGGQTRMYQLYVPAIYNSNNAVPLVLNLHGYGSNNTQQMSYGNFKPIADTANFLILAPQGSLDQFSTAHWNANWGTGVDDIGFLSALIDTVSANYSINQNRIYSTGMSNGGFMSFTLAGQLSNKITAVASVTGTMSILQIPANTVTIPMPIMQIHGTADATVDYNGDANFLSVDDVLNYWIGHNNCNTTPIVTQVPDINTADGCTAERYDYINGDNGAEVVHYKITPGAHTWPGAPFSIGVTNQDFNASVEIWKFFSKYEKQTLLSAVQKEVEHPTYKLIGENPSEGVFIINSNHSKNFDVTVYDITGKVVVSKSSQKNQTLIDLTSQKSGIYFCTFIGENHKVTLKLVRL
jgi:polyhydroxybutyrate depolymerase